MTFSFKVSLVINFLLICSLCNFLISLSSVGVGGKSMSSALWILPFKENVLYGSAFIYLHRDFLGLVLNILIKNFYNFIFIIFLLKTL